MIYTETVAGDIYIRCDDSSGRRSRAAQINARKRSYERDHRVTLTLHGKSYSETFGFLSRSEFHYHASHAARIAELELQRDEGNDYGPDEARELAALTGQPACLPGSGSHDRPARES